MALGYPNQNGGRTTDAAMFHALGNIFKGSWASGFKVRQGSPLGMSVRIGGESGIPDDILIRDSTGATFPVCNLNAQPVSATVPTANSANPRIDTVVVYIDSNVPASQTVANNENRAKVAVVAGTPATNPSAPSVSQIKSTIGSNSAYAILADIRVNRAVTSISDSVITDRREAVSLNHAPVLTNSGQLSDDIVLPRHLSTAARGDYSTSEVDTGKKWVDGKTVYAKTVSCGKLPNSSQKQTAHNVSGIDNIVNFFGTARENNGNTIAFPFVHDNLSVSGIKITVDRTNVVIGTSRDWSQFNNAYITFEYTKN